MKKKQKGFTLVEILAAVTILGILSVIAIVSVNSIIQSSKEKHYTTAESQLKLAGQSYTQQNRSALPKAIGQKTKVSLESLVDSNYIEPIKDYSENDCDIKNSYVQIFKYSQTEYSYLPYLDCPVYTSEEELTKSQPTVTVELSEENKTKKASAKMTASDNEKLLSWSYVVYKDNKEVFNSGSVMIKDYAKNVSKTLDLSKYTPGDLKVVVTATNIYGITTTKTSTKHFVDRQPPTCIIKDVDKNPKPWTAQNVTVTVGCDDGDGGSGCKRKDYTKTFKSSAKNGTIYIEDEEGNRTACTVSVNIDKTKPTTPTMTLKKWKDNSTRPTSTSGLSSYSAGTWSNKKVYVSASGSTDSHSGISYYEYQATGSAAGSAHGASTSIETEGTSTIKYRACDNVGNCSSWATEQTVKVDYTAPVITKITNPSNGNVAALGLKLTLEGTDNQSGIAKWRHSKNTSSWTDYANSNKSPFTTPAMNDRQNNDIYISVCDTAGNCSGYQSTHVFLVGECDDGYKTISSYGEWGSCSKSCGGGTQSRTNNLKSTITGASCGTTTESQDCNTMECCSSYSYKDGSSCTAVCGGGTKNRLAYSDYDGSRCPAYDVSYGGSACNTQGCCSSVKYEDGSTCTASCGGGTKNQLAYSNYTGERCPTEDKSSGGAACNTTDCCETVRYEDGTTCSATCDGGTYNRLAYSTINGQRCPAKDTSTGGAACNTQPCTCNETVISGYGEWSACDASCGTTGTQYRDVYLVDKYDNSVSCRNRATQDTQSCDGGVCPHTHEYGGSYNSISGTYKNYYAVYKGGFTYTNCTCGRSHTIPSSTLMYEGQCIHCANPAGWTWCPCAYGPCYETPKPTPTPTPTPTKTSTKKPTSTKTPIVKPGFQPTAMLW